MEVSGNTDNRKPGGVGRRGLLSLTPLLVFLLVYVLSSVIAEDFYAVPVSSAFLIACIYAVAVAGGSLAERVRAFSNGAGNQDIMLMIWIFMLAGAFAGTAKAIGSVDATVSFMLGIIPPGIILAGLFVTACLISMAMGTSVGTIVALVPIGAGIAGQCGLSQPFMAAIVVGGAFFGDNLSFISDTTIAATQAAGCEMADKFKANLLIVMPAFVVVTVIYMVMGREVGFNGDITHANPLLVLPYMLVIVLALLRLDVTLVLTVGVVTNAVIGFLTGSYGWTGWMKSVGEGIAGMSDLIIVTLLAGGLLEMIRRGGGLDLIINTLTRHIDGNRGAQAAIACLVSLANVCTANNTIAIITTGRIAHDVARKFGVSARKTASLMDTFSCLVQSLIPYGAQLLMAAGLASISSSSIIPYLYYPFLMGLCAIISIAFSRR